MFKCLWLLGAWTEEDRPDLLGAFIIFTEINIGERNVLVIQIIETKKGSLSKPRAQEIADRYREEGYVVMLYHIESPTTYRPEMKLYGIHFTSFELDLLRRSLATALSQRPTAV